MLPSIVKRWLCKPKQHMLQIINQIMDERIPNERPNRDFHIKFPDEFLQDHLEVQLWFAAECLVAGSLIEMQEAEALLLRPLAEEMLHSLEEVRRSLRDQCLSDASVYPDLLKEALVRFDCSFAEFELSYVSAVVPIKSPEELFQQQQIIVLFCETIERALKLGYLSQEMIDSLEPVLMFTIPRLAIICGLLIYPEGPLSLHQQNDDMSKLFSPFYSILQKIRDILYVLTDEELFVLEKSLCAAEPVDFFNTQTMLPSLSSLQNGSLNTRAIDGEVLSVQYARPHDPLKLIIHQDGLSCASNLPNQTRTETTDSSDTASLRPKRRNEEEMEIRGQMFHLSTATGRDADESELSRERFFSDTPEMLSFASTDDVNYSKDNSMRDDDFHLKADDSELNDELGTKGTFASNSCTFQSETLDTSNFPTIYEQTPTPRSPCYTSYAEEILNRASGLALFPGGNVNRQRMDHPDLRIGMKSNGNEMNKGATCEGGITNLSQSPGDLHSRKSDIETVPLATAHEEALRCKVRAIKATARENVRSRYHSSSDMIHRLFVCISGVADQLQTNFAGDLRRILKAVFQIATSRPEMEVDLEQKAEEERRDEDPSLEDCVLCQQSRSHSSRASTSNNNKLEVPPEWITDSACSQCMSCKAPFTILRRRHHCRNCGKIFCSRCSSHSATLPWYGHMKPVRVCTHCYTFHLSPCFDSSTC
eukprot:gi/632978989/ref/XP_007906217.1/ PREDICTED: lateral signaling target protein 2 homolog isoform X3 [Callorhinchus milii]